MICQQQTCKDAESFKETKVLMRNKFVGILRHESESNRFDIILSDINADQASNTDSY